MDPKHLTRTSFCNKNIDNVTDNSMKKYILDNMKLKTSQSFNSRYAKVYNEQYKNNLNNPHLVCLKSSGTQYLLFCTQINDINYCFMIDKKVKDGYEYPKIFIVHYRFSPEIFNGTLFEVELIRDKENNWSVLIGDIYTLNGESQKNIQITDRMNNCIDVMENKYIMDPFSDICPIKIKKYFDINKLAYIMNEFAEKLPYRIRGIYFVPMKASYSKILYILKDNDYKKVNSTNKKLINFRIIKTVKSDIYELYIYNENRTSIVKHSYASVPDIKSSRWLKDLTDSKEECFVECKLNDIFSKWTPIREVSSVDTLLDIKD